MPDRGRSHSYLRKDSECKPEIAEPVPSMTATDWTSCIHNPEYTYGCKIFLSGTWELECRVIRAIQFLRHPGTPPSLNQDATRHEILTTYFELCWALYPCYMLLACYTITILEKFFKAEISYYRSLRPRPFPSSSTRLTGTVASGIQKCRNVAGPSVGTAQQTALPGRSNY